MGTYDKASLHNQARLALQAGKLPSGRADRVVGGSGTGEMCPVCGESIVRNEMELAIEFDDGALGPKAYHLHPRCCLAWELEVGRAAPGVDSSRETKQARDSVITEIRL